MFYIEKDNTIHITRGDAASFVISVCNPDGTEYQLTTRDSLTFTVRSHAYDSDVLFEKKTDLSTGGVVSLVGKDTSNLPYGGNYWYDVRLTFADGTVNVIIPTADHPLSRLCIEPEVGWTKSSKTFTNVQQTPQLKGVLNTTVVTKNVSNVTTYISPAMAPVGGVCTWEIPAVGDCVASVSLVETGEVILCDMKHLDDGTLVIEFASDDVLDEGVFQIAVI